MRNVIRNNYFLVALTLVSLVGGLILKSIDLSLLSIGSYAIGATVGLALSIVLLISAIRHGEFGSDVLALISIVATVLTGEWLAASVIAVMLSGGRALETWAEGRARNQLSALLARAPSVAHLVASDGQVREIPLSQVSIGDRLQVRAGEVVPIDGRLLIDGTFDESALTGEPLPQFRPVDFEINSGVLNSGSEIELITTSTSENSTYSNLIRLVSQAQANSAAGVRIANKWAVRFVPFALGLAGLTWLISGNVTNAVAVIVAATPCPLILAVPVAIIAGMSRAAARGAIIKGGASLENLARAKVVLLDKTGTLTRGGPEISAMIFAPGAADAATLQLAASLEQSSPHIVAKAIVAEAQQRGLALTRATEVREDHGTGLSGLVNGSAVTVGQPQAELPEWAKISNSLIVAISVDGKLRGVIGLDDPVRTEAIETVAALRLLGITRVAMISGDRRSTADQVGQEVGLDEVFADCKPDEKLAIVAREMKASSGTVIAVGDGINDAPALAAATVGVAMGARGSTAASEAADVVIIEDSIAHLADAIDVAQGARSRALQAAGVGMTLASVAMVFGAVGIFSPTASAVTQEFIDAAAILWALVPASSRIRKPRIRNLIVSGSDIHQTTRRK
jgi:heavy metal translocating P-type ATPase